MQLNTPRSPHRTTSDNVYYVRFWVGFCLGNGWFLSFVKFAADEPDQNALAMLNDISGGRPVLVAATLLASQARCSPIMSLFASRTRKANRTKLPARSSLASR